MSGNMCESCANYVYDEEDDDFFCNADMDEDEYSRFLTSKDSCPFYRNDNEYEIVKHQN
ncbi:MAG: DUF6472 family protein [Lachnospiraceae bacterium]|jgi:hypothetical protein|nr:DUF6472 family protein [Lachnospiraceae bacterium]